MDTQLDRAVDRAMDLISQGRKPGMAFTAAGEECGYTASDVASASAQRKVRVEDARRIEGGVLTVAQAKDFLRRHLSGRVDVPPHIRRAASRVFFNTMTLPRAERNLIAEVLAVTDPMIDADMSVVHDEVRRLWAHLPAGFDPRIPRKLHPPLPETSFLYPLLMNCAIYRYHR